MTTLSAFLTELARLSHPMLTTYSTERVELNGPVLARWIAKIANLAGSDLAGALFGDEDMPGAFRIHAELWTDLVWSLALRAMGWTRSGDDVQAAPGDLLLVNELNSRALSDMEAGAYLFAQPRNFLSFSWTGKELPTQAFDALAELMGQPDALAVTPPAFAPDLEAIAVSGKVVASGDAHVASGHSVSTARNDHCQALVQHDAARVCLFLERTHLGALSQAHLGHLLEIVLGWWLKGSSLVLVDGAYYSLSVAQRIRTDEGASAFLTWDPSACLAGHLSESGAL